MTEVVNIKKDKYDVYIGRGSTFGNPYKIGPEDEGKDGTREEVIEKYKSWFYYQIKNHPLFQAEVLKLKNKRIGCYCHPLSCHGDVIKGYLDSLDPCSYCHGQGEAFRGDDPNQSGVCFECEGKGNGIYE